MSDTDAGTAAKSWLPAIGTWKFHALLGAVAILVLGPLGGVTASFMNFKLGFFVGGQVLAGILGSAVTFGYGREGRHGANYMQTMAASVATMAAMGTLVQAMVWLGLPMPPAWQLVAYFMSIGMLGVGVGMLYTPILVDRLQLPYPSGLAVANILRALTDKTLLKRSIARLGGGTAAGAVGALAANKIPWLEATGLSTATLGGGLIVGARIGVPAIVAGVVFKSLQPYFVAIGWLDPDAPFRKLSFLIALGMIMGAAVVDLAIIFYRAAARVRERAAAVPQAGAEEWKRTNTGRLVAWVAFWAIAVVVSGRTFLHLPFGFLAAGLVLVFLFALVNGISQGITDQNPISSAFVVTMLLMALVGLRDPGQGLLCAGIVLVATSVACDMQQDRSTGWRLGTSRIVQFRYQVIGITVGAILTVVMTRLFMEAYPVLKVNALANAEVAKDSGWSSAMTYKFVGAMEGLAHPKPFTAKAIEIGLALGFATELFRKLLRRSAGYQRFSTSSIGGKVMEFVVDAILLPSPYASSFGGFLNLEYSLWFGGGGIASSLFNHFTKPRAKVEAVAHDGEVPEDMSTTSLVGGGLIAGEALAALGLGVLGLLATL